MFNFKKQKEYRVFTNLNPTSFKLIRRFFQFISLKRIGGGVTFQKNLIFVNLWTQSILSTCSLKFSFLQENEVYCTSLTSSPQNEAPHFTVCQRLDIYVRVCLYRCVWVNGCASTLRSFLSSTYFSVRFQNGPLSTLKTDESECCCCGTDMQSKRQMHIMW